MTVSIKGVLSNAVDGVGEGLVSTVEMSRRFESIEGSTIYVRCTNPSCRKIVRESLKQHHVCGGNSSRLKYRRVA